MLRTAGTELLWKGYSDLDVDVMPNCSQHSVDEVHGRSLAASRIYCMNSMRHASDRNGVNSIRLDSTIHSLSHHAVTYLKQRKSSHSNMQLGI